MFTVTSAQAPTFEEYAEVSWPSLYRYAYLLTGNHADAEDLAQQTLLKAYRSWSRVSRSDSPTAYLRRMLTNTYLSGRRPMARRLELLTDRPPEQGQVAGSGPEERMVLWPHVTSLPPRQRAVIVLRYYEGLDEREIAEALDCSTGTVKSTAHRALKALRAALGQDEEPTTTPGSDDTDGRED
ncbi:SigE family RNA polymerase sigma factor [Nocardioides guangzhouensis]|uniref:SigE family RNA polymerase sigma factor n=1 Tax=Nocardioides guangzhouensis TaxID=2497878 RepID=A0A4Q4Z7S2_9ACTN|nr:SigE family RNA polymerase sigma factor [Nocardioides guangzhouensis]RYP83823.1 SigE family RNA polymerase sigma factor [Nocardioides guangzhouensis]